MSVPIELWKNWEGKLADGKFSLQKWLGGSDHSVVFLTERGGQTPQKAAIKLMAVQDATSAIRLSNWAAMSKFSHPHLIRPFEYGRCEIDGTPLLYVVTEFADENLAEVLPVRSLSSDEIVAVLRPAAEALQFLHDKGFVHSRIKPSNIMAVGEQLKLSADAIRKINEPGTTDAITAYAAPEAASGGFTPATDIWSLGLTMLAVATQTEPKGSASAAKPIAVPDTLPQAIRGIIQRCLQIDPAKRPSASEILGQISGGRSQSKTDVSAAHAAPGREKTQSRIWAIVSIVIVALLLLAWIGNKTLGHQPTPAPTVSTQTAPPDTKAESVPVPATPPSATPPSAKTGLVRGTVRSQVPPDVSRSALHTITGRLKVAIRVSVDADGNVTTAKLMSSGPSAYFSGRALAAARQWKFTPPQLNGKAVASEWLLRFQFTRSSAQVVPTEIKP
jgi:TonB family protein